MELEAVVGLEVHAELDTRTKLFCGCGTAFGAPPNTQVCPVCLGMPGVLPVINRKAFEHALRAALALNCRIPERTAFDRKNYFYPDLPKNYQISQSYRNLGTDGWVEIIVNGCVRRIGIWNVHLEEDAGKLVHPEDGQGNYSLVDLNRAGVPLLEIVSAPEMHSAAEAESFMRALRGILLYTGVSDCRMQEGKLRFEPSVSLRPAGKEVLGARVEIKNIGSISAAARAVEYEIERQRAIIAEGGQVSQETRLWDERLQRTVAMRRKETSADYRYFPEPDLVEICIEREWLERLRQEIPELPVARRLRFRDRYGLSDYDAGVLTEERALADYFERCVSTGGASPKAIANCLANDVLRYLNERGKEIGDFACPPEHIVHLVAMVEQGEINVQTARDVFVEMVDRGLDPRNVVRERGLAQISDSAAVAAIVEKVLAENPQAVADYRAGKKAAFNALIGPVMRATRGKANPRVVREILQKRLDETC